MATAKRIDCPAPLPEDTATALLTEMLFLAPYEVPEKKAKKKGMGTRKGLRRKVVSDSLSEDTEAHSSNKNEEEEEENPPPQTEWEKKRKVAPSGEAEGSRKGRTLPPDHSTTAAYNDEEWLPRDKPLAKSQVSGYHNTSGMFCFIDSYHVKYDRAVRPKPASTYPPRMGL